MKNLKTTILTALIALIGLTAKAQTTTTATLNLKLNTIQSISIHHGQPTVDLEYSTVQDYQEGVSVTKKNHVEVFSTGGFQVQVKANDLVNGGNTIDSETILIEASEGNIQHSTPSFTPVNLTQTNQTLITSPVGGSKERFDIKYSGTGLYFNKEIGTYTTQVTYTISPQ